MRFTSDRAPCLIGHERAANSAIGGSDGRGDQIDRRWILAPLVVDEGRQHGLALVDD